MTFETVENVLQISTNSVMTIAMAAVLLLIGYFIIFRTLGKSHDAAVMCAGLCFVSMIMRQYPERTQRHFHASGLYSKNKHFITE